MKCSQCRTDVHTATSAFYPCERHSPERAEQLEQALREVLEAEAGMQKQRGWDTWTRFNRAINAAHNVLFGKGRP